MWKNIVTIALGVLVGEMLVGVLKFVSMALIYSVAG